MLLRSANTWVAMLLTIGIFCGISWVSAPVHAQDVTARGAGIIGGAVGGAEVVMAVESIIRVKPLWPYIVFPILGAVGGGIGGYKLEQKTRGGSIALLITSMVAVIPTIIGVSSARGFHPEDAGAKKGDKATPESTLTIDTSGNTIDNSSTTTEIEAKPDGLPAGPLGPPAPAPATTDIPGAENAPSTESPSSSNESPNRLPPTDIYSHLNTMEQERIAHLSGGALFHMNRSLRLGLGIPAIDVYPLELPHPHENLRGIEFHVPVIAIDLP